MHWSDLSTWANLAQIVSAPLGVAALIYAAVSTSKARTSVQLAEKSFRLGEESVRIAKAEGAESNERLIRERRVDFQLSVLLQMATIEPPSLRTEFPVGGFGVLAALLDPDLVPCARAMAMLTTTTAAIIEMEQAVSQGGARVAELIQAEITVAAEKLKAIQ